MSQNSQQRKTLYRSKKIEWAFKEDRIERQDSLEFLVLPRKSISD